MKKGKFILQGFIMGACFMFIVSLFIGNISQSQTIEEEMIYKLDRNYQMSKWGLYYTYKLSLCLGCPLDLPTKVLKIMEEMAIAGTTLMEAK